MPRNEKFQLVTDLLWNLEEAARFRRRDSHNTARVGPPSFVRSMFGYNCFIFEVSYPQSLPVEEELPKAYFCLCRAGEKSPPPPCLNIKSQTLKVGLGLPFQNFTIPSNTSVCETPKPGKLHCSFLNCCCLCISLIPIAHTSFFCVSSLS